MNFDSGIKHKLVYLDEDSKQVFDIQVMTSKKAQIENIDLMSAGSRRRWVPAKQGDYVNVPKHRRAQFA